MAKMEAIIAQYGTARGSAAPLLDAEKLRAQFEVFYDVAPDQAIEASESFAGCSEIAFSLLRLCCSAQANLERPYPAVYAGAQKGTTGWWRRGGR
jgi:hypothetical protein